MLLTIWEMCSNSKELQNRSHCDAWSGLNLFFSFSNEPSFPSNNILKQRRITERNCIKKHFTIVLIYEVHFMLAKRIYRFAECGEQALYHSYGNRKEKVLNSQRCRWKFPPASEKKAPVKSWANISKNRERQLDGIQIYLKVLWSVHPMLYA